MAADVSDKEAMVVTANERRYLLAVKSSRRRVLAVEETEDVVMRRQGACAGCQRAGAEGA